MTDNAATPVDVMIEERTGMRKELGTCDYGYHAKTAHRITNHCDNWKPIAYSEPPTQASIETILNRADDHINKIMDAVESRMAAKITTLPEAETSLRDGTWAFYPEKVERPYCIETCSEMVYATDWDNLLALYRELERKFSIVSAAIDVLHAEATK